MDDLSFITDVIQEAAFTDQEKKLFEAAANTFIKRNRTRIQDAVDSVVMDHATTNIFRIPVSMEHMVYFSDEDDPFPSKNHNDWHAKYTLISQRFGDTAEKREMTSLINDLKHAVQRIATIESWACDVDTKIVYGHFYITLDVKYKTIMKY